MPRHLEKLSSNVDPDNKTKVEDHIDDFYMHLRMLELRYGDFYYKIFHFTLEGRVTIWYHNMLVNLVHGWREFKKLFLEKFTDDKTLAMLLK